MLYMSSHIISLPEGSSLENLQALAEVQDFATTETGWTYRILPEPLLTAELTRASDARQLEIFDSISFQPCHFSRNQDRRTIENWDFAPGGLWSFAAVFDGHSGDETVNHIMQTLPSLVKDSLRSILDHRLENLSPDTISQLLSDAFVHLDDSIRSDFLETIQGDAEHLDKITVAETQEILNGGANGWNRKLAIRCTQGATAILALTNPEKNGLWIANLGDCQAVLATRRDTTSGWSASLINSVHNGSNREEEIRIRSEHPGEENCVRNGRVLGYLAPTRALGDTWLKLPAVYTRRVFADLDLDLGTRRAHELAARISTPPYVSNIPDTYYHVIDSADSFLIICSDGLADLYSGMSLQEAADHWVTVIGRAIDAKSDDEMPNLSLYLLRDAIGGNEADIISRNLTLEMEEQWMDDTSIVVQRFR